MNELSKMKLPFALALLAAMFSLTPLIHEYESWGFALFSMTFTVKLAFDLFCVLLGFSVYAYALGLVGGHRVFRAMNWIGNATYAIALAAPAFLLILYGFAKSVSLISATRFPALVTVMETGLTVLASLLSGFIGNLIFSAFTERDRQARLERFDAEEDRLLARARRLYEEDYHDLAVAEAWKAIEVGINKVMEALGKPRGYPFKEPLLRAALRMEFLSTRQIEELESLRQIRNLAVHTETRVSREDADKALSIAEKVLSTLGKVEDRCYFCDRLYPIRELDIDKTTGASACKACRQKNPDWRDKLVVVGMDP